MSKIVTGKVRFSYVNVFEPRSMNESQEPKYSVCVIIDKKDKETLAKVNAAIEQTKEEFVEKWGGKILPNLKLALRDGDLDHPDREEFIGKFFLNCSSKNKPGVVDADTNPILDKNEIYSGCYGRVSINFFPYNNNGNKGVAAGLNNLQKLADGPRLAGGSSASEDFGGGLLD